ncbi:MAG TPA: arylesterase [Burkholderiales bacterium]|nr:arylesterase [Burkholderiales bacterium]
MTRTDAPARRWWAAPLVGLLFAACGGSTPPLAPLEPSAVVLAFGDSLTFGTGAADGEGYPAQLERLIGRKVVAQGVPGEVSAQGLARLPGVLDATQPRLLLLCHGGNDLLRKLPESEAAANVRAMVRLAREKGIAVVLIGVPKPGLSPSPASFYADIAKEFAVPYEGSILKTVLTDNALKSDWVHPNAKGYARIAEAMADLLRKAKAIR